MLVCQAYLQATTKTLLQKEAEIYRRLFKHMQIIDTFSLGNTIASHYYKKQNPFRASLMLSLNVGSGLRHSPVPHQHHQSTAEGRNETLDQDLQASFGVTLQLGKKILNRAEVV